MNRKGRLPSLGIRFDVIWLHKILQVGTMQAVKLLSLQLWYVIFTDLEVERETAGFQTIKAKASIWPLLLIGFSLLFKCHVIKSRKPISKCVVFI